MNDLICGKWGELGDEHSYDGIFKTTLINEIKKINKPSNNCIDYDNADIFLDALSNHMRINHDIKISWEYGVKENSYQSLENMTIAELKEFLAQSILTNAILNNPIKEVQQ
tara:strand:- start:293 stop:625 length:333 start_codon:yes stop_codon:yes gene_type:complete